MECVKAFKRPCQRLLLVTILEPNSGHIGVLDVFVWAPFAVRFGILASGFQVISVKGAILPNSFGVAESEAEAREELMSDDNAKVTPNRGG